MADVPPLPPAVDKARDKIGEGSKTTAQDDKAYFLNRRQLAPAVIKRIEALQVAVDDNLANALLTPAARRNKEQTGLIKLGADLLEQAKSEIDPKTKKLKVIDPKMPLPNDVKPLDVPYTLTIDIANQYMKAGDFKSGYSLMNYAIQQSERNGHGDVNKELKAYKEEVSKFLKSKGVTPPMNVSADISEPVAAEAPEAKPDFGKLIANLDSVPLGQNQNRPGGLSDEVRKAVSGDKTLAI